MRDVVYVDIFSCQCSLDYLIKTAHSPSIAESRFTTNRLKLVSAASS